MFRSETLRERTLLRVIEQQQQTIRDLTDRLMYQAGQPWQLPPLPENTVVPDEPEQPVWSQTPEQEPLY
jgi:hypothetical protein